MSCCIAAGDLPIPDEVDRLLHVNKATSTEKNELFNVYTYTSRDVSTFNFSFYFRALFECRIK